MPTVMFSQNYKKDILEVSKYFTELKNYSLVMHYKLFLDGDLTRPYQEREVKISRLNKNLIIQQTNGLETLENDSYQIVINNKNKVFSARKKEKDEDHYEEIPEFNTYLSSSLDSLLIIYEKIKVLTNSADKISYELTLKPNNPTEKVIMVIDKKTKMFHSMTIKYKQPVPINQLDGKPHLLTLQISYENFKPNAIQSKTLFDENKFITVAKDGRIYAVKKYANYKLIIPNEDF